MSSQKWAKSDKPQTNFQENIQVESTPSIWMNFIILVGAWEEPPCSRNPPDRLNSPRYLWCFFLTYPPENTLTWQWNIHHLKMFFMLILGTFHCHRKDTPYLIIDFTYVSSKLSTCRWASPLSHFGFADRPFNFEKDDDNDDDDDDDDDPIRPSLFLWLGQEAAAAMVWTPVMLVDHFKLVLEFQRKQIGTPRHMEIWFMSQYKITHKEVAPLADGRGSRLKCSSLKLVDEYISWRVYYVYSIDSSDNVCHSVANIDLNNWI